MTGPRHWYETPHAPVPGTVLGSLGALADGQALMQTLPAASPLEKPFRYLLLRSGDSVRAFVNRCAHFGVPLAERQEHLHFQPHVSVTCNVHYAKYRWEDGACLSGECEGSPLLSIPVEVDAGGTIRAGAARPPSP